MILVVVDFHVWITASRSLIFVLVYIPHDFPRHLLSSRPSHISRDARCIFPGNHCPPVVPKAVAHRSLFRFHMQSFFLLTSTRLLVLLLPPTTLHLLSRWLALLWRWYFPITPCPSFRLDNCMFHCLFKR